MITEIKLTSTKYWNEVAEQRHREDREKRRRAEQKSLIFSAVLAIVFCGGLAWGLLATGGLA